MNLELNVVGRIESQLKDLDSAHRQPDEGAGATGVHRVEIIEIAGTRIKVPHLEAVDGTPIVDVKPILAEDLRQR
jgi:tRNA (Thr-GGU) A37 N-methylase